MLFATHDRTLLDVRPRRIVVLDEGKATDVPDGLAAVDDDDDLEESLSRAGGNGLCASA